MVFWSIVVSIIFTVIILLLTLLTIQQGYDYKHTIDPPVQPSDEEETNEEEKETNRPSK